MESYIFPLFLLLGLSVIISPAFIHWQRKRIVWIKWGVTLLGIVFYVCWFVGHSFGGKSMNTYGVEVVNKLPQTVDFYLVKVSEDKKESRLKIIHSGKIRSEHYRLEHLDMDGFNELWLVGFLGKENLVYYSQHAIPNKNVDAVVEVNNYIITSRTLSEKAKKAIGNHIQGNYKLGALSLIHI